jgi:hypothetical protein
MRLSTIATICIYVKRKIIGINPSNMIEWNNKVTPLYYSTGWLPTSAMFEFFGFLLSYGDSKHMLFDSIKRCRSMLLLDGESCRGKPRLVHSPRVAQAIFTHMCEWFWRDYTWATRHNTSILMCARIRVINYALHRVINSTPRQVDPRVWVGVYTYISPIPCQ